MDRLRSLDRVALRSRPVAPPRTVATPPRADAQQPVLVPPEAAPRSRRGPSPRLRAAGWRCVAAVAGLVAMVSTPLGRHGLLGPAIVVLGGAVLTFWWGPVFYVLVATLTAAVWVWAERVHPDDV